MYPQRELIWLANHKTALRRDIALHRVQCADAAARVTRPLAWLDRLLTFWRRLSPLVKLAAVAVPIGILVKRKAFPRRNILGSLVNWSRLIFFTVRGINSMGKTRKEISPATNGRG